MSYGSPPPPPPPPPPSYGGGGQPPQPPYGGGQPPYGGQPYPSYGGGQPYGSQQPYAHWIKRVGAYFIDYIITVLVVLIPGIIGGVLMGHSYTRYEDQYGYIESTKLTNHGLFAVGLILLILAWLLVIGFGIWNQCIRQGRTGQTIGKGVLGIRLVKESTGQPLGGWLCFGRQFLHILDSLCCCIGFLWPLWDAKRQTFADKLVSSIVIDGGPVTTPSKTLSQGYPTQQPYPGQQQFPGQPPQTPPPPYGQQPPQQPPYPGQYGQ